MRLLALGRGKNHENAFQRLLEAGNFPFKIAGASAAAEATAESSFPAHRETSLAIRQFELAFITIPVTPILE